MGIGTLGLFTALASILAAPFLKHALDMYRSQNYREMAGSIFFSAIPLCVVCLVWAGTGEAPMRIQNSLLGLVGAALGASAFIWLGYVVRPVVAQGKNEADKKETTPVAPVGSPSVRIAPGVGGKVGTINFENSYLGRGMEIGGEGSVDNVNTKNTYIGPRSQD